MTDEMKARILPPLEQKQDTLFHMCMLFRITSEDPKLNKSFKEIFDLIGVQRNSPQLTGTLRMEQTVSFIPDEKVIHKYEKAMVGKPFLESTTVTKAEFIGYEFLYMVRPETDTEPDA